MVRSLPEMEETRVQSLSQKSPLEKGMPTHSNILVQGQRSLQGYSSWGRKEWDMTE